MTVSDERPGLADLARDITIGENAVFPATRLVPLAPPAGVDDLPRYLHALRRLADADDLAAAHSGCTLAVDVAGRDGSAAGLAMAYSQRSSVARRLGRLADALRDADASAELLAVSGTDPAGPAAALVLARRLAVLLDLGDLDLADSLLTATGLDGDLPDEPEFLLLRYVRGLLHTAAARPGEGLAELYR